MELNSKELNLNIQSNTGDNSPKIVEKISTNTKVQRTVPVSNTTKSIPKSIPKESTKVNTNDKSTNPKKEQSQSLEKLYKSVYKDLVDSSDEDITYGSPVYRRVDRSHIGNMDHYLSKFIRVFDTWLQSYVSDSFDNPFDKDKLLWFIREMRSVFAVVGSNNHVYYRALSHWDSEGGFRFKYAINKESTWANFQATHKSYSIKINIGDNDESNIVTVNFLDIVKHFCLVRGYAKYANVEYIPSRNEDVDILNLWTGLQLPIFVEDSSDPKSKATLTYYKYGKWNKLEPHPYIMHHIKYVLANGDEIRYTYIIKYMAVLVQRTYKKTGKCLIFIGKPGAGKNTIWEFFGRFMFLDRYGMITKMDTITGKFNANWITKQFVICNEIVSDNGKMVIDVETLKSLITDRDCSKEGKYSNSESSINSLNMIILSNSNLPLPIEDEDRRFVALDVSNEYCGNTAYFDQLHSVLTPYQAFLLYNMLLHVDISDFDLNKFPETDIRDEIINSSNSVRAFINAFQWNRLLEIRDELEFNEVFRIYKEYCRDYQLKPFGGHRFKATIQKLNKIVSLTEDPGKITIQINREYQYNGHYWPLDLDKLGINSSVCTYNDKFTDDDVSVRSNNSKAIRPLSSSDKDFDQFISNINLQALHVNYRKRVEREATNRGKKPKIPYAGGIPFKDIHESYKEYIITMRDRGIQISNITQRDFYNKLKHVYREGSGMNYTFKGGDGQTTYLIPITNSKSCNSDINSDVSSVITSSSNQESSISVQSEYINYELDTEL